MLTNLLLLVATTGNHLFGEIILIVICVLTCAYLLAALLWPEEF